MFKNFYDLIRMWSTEKFLLHQSNKLLFNTSDILVTTFLQPWTNISFKNNTLWKFVPIYREGPQIFFILWNLLLQFLNFLCHLFLSLFKLLFVSKLRQMKLDLLWFLLFLMINFIPVIEHLIFLFQLFLLLSHFNSFMLRQIYQSFSLNFTFTFNFHLFSDVSNSLFLLWHFLRQGRIFFQYDFNILLLLLFYQLSSLCSQVFLGTPLLLLRLHVHLLL